MKYKITMFHIFSVQFNDKFNKGTLIFHLLYPNFPIVIRRIETYLLAQKMFMCLLI